MREDTEMRCDKARYGITLPTCNLNTPSDSWEIPCAVPDSGFHHKPLLVFSGEGILKAAKGIPLIFGGSL